MSGEIDPILSKRNKCESRRGKNINKLTVTEDEHSGLAKPQNAETIPQPVSKNSDSSKDLEPGINLEREFDAVRKRNSNVGRQEAEIKKMYSKKRYGKKMYRKEE